MEILKQIKISLLMLMFFMLLTGAIYPLIVTGIAQVFFPYQANGSLIMQEGKIVGSELIGQNFISERYFSGRPSATQPAYNPLHSSGSNFGPSNPKFLTILKNRVDELKKNNPDAKIRIPVDLVTASASGLDPHISVKAAIYQVPRIAKARKLKTEDLEKLVLSMKQDSFIFAAEVAYVNVLKLNLALDKIK